VKLHLGCGKQYKEGYVNIDKNPNVGADIVMNMEEEWPFEDNSVDEVYSYHALEHCKEYLKVMGEMYRVCKPGALLYIGVPYISSSIYNAINPYHHTHFNEYSFDFFDSDKLKGTANEHTEIELKTESVTFTYFKAWRDKSEEEKRFARKHYWNVVSKIDFVLRVVK
jgi:predicted SAM-dependent methyltransferase